ncbi:cell division protein ZapE [uncultured Albimonas sp.]|uniref:cell division protein ZapE n=1 Tax=uncultured Albimonas sp. TaxID=1331701 RepID=UPI0030EDEAE9|tara:strand:+ start:311 stop:1555 length:1245 start_codon:yes stop_codon:yes gene_type:complete
MTSPAETPLARYRALVKAGDLTADPAQAQAAEQLQLLHDRLKNYDPKAGKKVARGWFGWGREKNRQETLCGLYIYGGVGRGKSMLMDLFHDIAPVSPKRRVHFHAFMQEVHAGIKKARERHEADPIQPVAEAIADSATLLCFDEMQITDIADAMIVGRLFEALFARGVVVVTTSNRHPDDLYKDGLNRAIFLPFIEILKEKLDVHHLDGDADHRQDRSRGDVRYLSPLGPETAAEMDRLWAEQGETPEAPLTLEFPGRRETFKRGRPGERGRPGALRAGFEELCARPLGPADYLALAEAVEVLMIEDVPRLSRARNNEAKRFVTLIDALYEAKTKIYVSAAAEPETLYEDGPGAFEFERTASRIEEMRGEDWPPAPAAAAAARGEGGGEGGAATANDVAEVDPGQAPGALPDRG